MRMHPVVVVRCYDVSGFGCGKSGLLYLVMVFRRSCRVTSSCGVSVVVRCTGAPYLVVRCGGVC